jgi:thioredoxin:protein disulfide reductase
MEPRTAPAGPDGRAIRARRMKAIMQHNGWILFWALFAPTVFAADLAGSNPLAADEEEFLSVDQAFVFSASLDQDGSLRAAWHMPDGYYLYRQRFEFNAAPDSGFALGEPEIPKGKVKVDDYFGEVQVYYHDVAARVPVTRTAPGAKTLVVTITYQGCADRGLCYPPQKKQVSFAADAIAATAAQSVAPIAPAKTGSGAGDNTEEQHLAGLLAQGHLLLALALFFAAGVGLAFTPCVLPMVPILSSIIVGQGEGVTRMRAFMLSLAYVLGMAFTYATLGVVVGLFGAKMNLQAALQSPPVLITFAVVFVLLALSMFGLYELQLPQAWQNRVNALSQNQRGGAYVGVAVMGSLSSLVVSPCLSAPLAGALIYLSSTGDALLGGSALLALGLGMGVPLLVIGSSGAHVLPKAGGWMVHVKSVFGVLLIGVAVWLLERVISPQATLLLWALLAIGVGVYLGALDFSPRRGWGQLWKASGAFSFVYGVLLVIGAASGAHDPLAPLAGFGGSAAAQTQKGPADLQWKKVRGIEALKTELAAAEQDGKPVALDFYADWCISCKVMANTVFTEPSVAAQLGRFHLLQADVTANDALDQELLQHFGLFGPPSMLFFTRDGGEISALRMQGEMDTSAFERHLGKVLAGV